MKRVDLGHHQIPGAPQSQAAEAGTAATLCPGANRLCFRVEVLRQGLYVLKHAQLRAGGALSLRLRACAPGEGGPPPALLATALPALPLALPDARQVAAPAASDAIGTLDPRGATVNHQSS